jgi:nucleotide-binding universal stress UspA family protein
MNKRILVPLDGSELAEIVFPYVKELAGRLDMDIYLLYVYGPGLRSYVPMNQAYIDRAAQTVKAQAIEVQKRVDGNGKAIDVYGSLLEGYAPDKILEFADEKNIDFIVIASHGRSGKTRWDMGNVAEKVLEAAKLPVLLVRAGVTDTVPYDKWPKITITVPLDGSEIAESVFPHVRMLAEQRSAEPVDVVFLRICEPAVIPSYYSPELSGVPLNWGDYMQQEMARSKKAAAEYLAKVQKQFEGGNIKVRTEILEGKAGDEIVNFAVKNPMNLIVMATHGRSGLSRLVYGSVAANLIHGVHNPIFIVKPTPR